MQQKVVICFNKECSSFEYIGEPIPLQYGENMPERPSLRQIIRAILAWLARNDRLTVRTIFKSLDKAFTGTLSQRQFLSAFQRIGIQLVDVEYKVLAQCLDQRSSGFLLYNPLLNEIEGIPQPEFVQEAFQKLAELVIEKDFSEEEFKTLLNPQHAVTMSHD